MSVVYQIHGILSIYREFSQKLHNIHGDYDFYREGEFDAISSSNNTKYGEIILYQDTSAWP